ncbi:MAG: CHAT domain-containing protein [Vicinamibacterales bacterium]
MTPKARTRALITLLAIASAVANTGAAPQRTPTEEERTVSPYVLLNGTLDMAQRYERYKFLAAAAEAAGDYVRAARHFSLACQAQFGLTNRIDTSECERARALARDHHVLDAEVYLTVVDATARAWGLDVPGAIAGVQGALARGAALDPDIPDGSPITGAHYLLGAIMIETGKFDLALRELTFSRDHCRKQGNHGCLALDEIWLCRLHTQLGNFADARAACDAAQAEVAPTRDDVFVVMSLGWIRASLEKAMDRHEASLASLQTSWRAAQMRGAEAIRPVLMTSIADALVTLGRLDEAEVWQQQLEHAIAAGLVPASYGPQTSMRRGQIAMARGKLDDAIAAFTLASASPLPEMAIGGDYALARARRARNDLPGARQALEQAIAKIETGRTNLNGSALRASYLTMHATAYSELIGVRWDAEGVASAPAALELAEAGRARALLDALKSAQVVGAAAPTLNAKAVQATLGPDAVLVEYVSLEDRLLALTVTRDRIAFTALPRAGTASELGRRVDFFSALVQESDEVALGPTARRLYADILAPALVGVPSTARTLIIAADGPLHQLPFDALGEGPRVIDRWDVVTLPSASAMANRVRRGTPTAAALVVAAPSNVPGLGDLPAAPAEAAAIRRRLGGEIAELSGAGATREGLDNLGPGRFAVLHFASHALVDETRPLRSALMLTPGRAGADGRWSADEIYRSNLGADLVVLSACSTAAGAQTAGEGVMSLARAFLYAGAGATIATLWDVPDAPGPIFADVLYKELADGRTLGAAAADARRELRRSGAPPRAWAAYVLTGNPGARVGVTARVDPRAVGARFAAGFAVVLLLVAAFLKFARIEWRLLRPAAALAGGGLAIIAIALQPWPSRYQLSTTGARADRGDAQLSFTPVIGNGQVTWSPVAGADEHLVQVYDDAGVPVGAPTAATSPFVLPRTTAGGWLRIEARDHSQLITRSTPIALH